MSGHLRAYYVAMAYIGERLKELRGSLTQAEVAERAGIKRTDYNRIERNARSVGRVLLERLAEALDVSVLELQPEAEADPLGLTLQRRQQELEAEVLRLAGDVTLLTRRVRALERREPHGSPARGSGAK